MRITTGYNDNGTQIFKYVGYYETRPAAMIALADYNANPYDLAKSKTTFADMFKLFIEKKYPDGQTEKNRSSWLGYHASFNHAATLHDMLFAKIRTNHMEDVIRKCDRSHGTKRKIKVLFNQLYKYALVNDFVTKDYSQYIEMPTNTTTSSRKPFAADEIQFLWGR